MALRKGKDESFTVNGSTEQWISKCENALKKGGFTAVNVNRTLSQITANYKKLTVWGDITITLHDEGNKTKISAFSNANVDNLFALFSSPNKKIISQFKDNL
ncbi:MAG: hypothetical protein J0L69_12915 [Bacteroidetes bacterium]|nr:hypothetical protein [Bacteroidota bacterium]